jgi:mRNA interferase RelE/StbE
MTYRVRLERAAVEGLAALDRSDAVQVHKRLKKLEGTPATGKPLGNKGGLNLTGFRKLVLCDRRVRVIYRVEEPDLVRVVVIGKREDFEVYRLAEDEIGRLGLRD